jgi:hypothetical protein
MGGSVIPRPVQSELFARLALVVREARVRLLDRSGPVPIRRCSDRNPDNFLWMLRLRFFCTVFGGSAETALAWRRS